MAGWVRALAWTGDGTVPAGFESTMLKINNGEIPKVTATKLLGTIVGYPASLGTLSPPP